MKTLKSESSKQIKKEKPKKVEELKQWELERDKMTSILRKSGCRLPLSAVNADNEY